MLCTKYRRVANNSVIRLLQSRYILVGWDAILACQVLGIDPFDPEDEPKLMLTKCSLGSLLQSLYASRPSGLVRLAGDYLFTDEGFAGTPKQFKYSVTRAIAIGLVKSNRDQTNVMTSHQTDQGTQSRTTTGKQAAVAPTEKHSIFQRRLAVISDDKGRLLFVDEKAPGSFAKNAETGIREYVVQDALSYMSILDIKPLLGNEKKLRFQ